MTNREWVNSLSNEQFVKYCRTFGSNPCYFCADNNKSECWCDKGPIEWLDMEHDMDGWKEMDDRYCWRES